VSEPGSSVRRRWLPAAATCGAVALLAAACQSGGPAASGTHASSAPTSGASHSAAAGEPLSITPASGSSGVNPARGITVAIPHGKITSVHVTTAGGPTGGTLSNGGSTWRSPWALAVSQRYTVTARAVTSSGQSLTRTSTFRTLTPGQTAQTMIFEGYRKTYGVGMPIMLTFSHAVTNKAAVERALQLRTSKPVVGAWYWDGSSTLDFRPRGYWPAHTVVSFTGHLNGVEEAPGVYGAHTLSQTFNIGSSLIVVASTSSHHMRLYRDGKLIDRWPISTGRPGDNTPSGTYVTIDKGNPVDMKGPGYNLEVPWSVRFTWTGDYLHDAYWSVGEQGSTNVSHGCVNMPPADAEAYYNMEVPGDPVTVTGSPRAGEWDNGWTEWFLPWNKYVAGSALHMAVEAGPNGSTFVRPSALPAATATAPLGQPAPDNWTAS
jgi:lipoprotein-anchoring transpeptidase ErfK/SrfK